MIIIGQKVYQVIDEYTEYLIREGLTSIERAIQKRMEITQAIHSNLWEIVNYRFSPYKDLGKDESCRLYVYKDSKSKTLWGFAYKQFDGNNVIVYYMKNMKLVKEN